MEISEIVDRIKTTPLSGLPPTERRHQLFILRLSKLEIFPAMVGRLNRGHTIEAVTDWFKAQDPQLQGDLADCLRSSLYTYINSLAIVMRRIRTQVVEAHPPSELLPKHIPTPSAPGYERILEFLRDKFENVHALDMLRYAYAIQQERVIEVRNLEKQLKLSLPHGTKAVALLKEIAAEVRKVETSEALLNLRMRQGALPGELDANPPAITLREVAVTQEFEDADKNLLRDITRKVLDLIDDEAARGQYSNRLEPDAGPAQGA